MTANNEPIFAPREIFEQILEYSVMVTFDLVIEMPDGSVVLVWRKIAPYQNVWALPGLRMYKNETIEQTLERIALQELGLQIDVANRRILGQYVGKFSTEHNRQDLSTGYVVKALSGDIKLNDDHFTRYKVVRSVADIPQPLGAMYKFYLQKYFE
jgi:ADP-ribose pyrophosphatase YjhB (NUDIX family)